MVPKQQAELSMHTLLITELLTRCITADGNAFTIRKAIGIYRQHFILTEDGWECDRRTDTTAILARTEQIRQFAAMYPELTVTYPHNVLQDDRAHTTETELWVESEATALIAVPESFVLKHGGSDFLALLEEQYPETISALAIAAEKRLLRHEVRTQRMFGKNNTVFPVVCNVTADAVCSEIWTLPLAEHGLRPLQWNGEVCGMARALANKLSESLQCEAAVSLASVAEDTRAYAIHLTIKDS